MGFFVRNNPALQDSPPAAVALATSTYPPQCDPSESFLFDR